MTAAPSVSAPVQALLDRAIDYAGRYPPASLDLPTALDNYLRYRDGPESWALGRFVVSAPSLAALGQELVHRGVDPVRPVPLSVLVGPDLPADRKLLGEFLESEHSRRGAVEAVELRGLAGGNAVAALASVPGTFACYVEVSLDGDLDADLAAISSHGGFAKIRTGGTVASAFPAPASLARFLGAAAARRLAFKATAGLHHPLRGSYRLTYAAGAASGPMYGYLNLAIAAAMAWIQSDPRQVEEALREEDRSAVRFAGDALVWRAHRLEPAALRSLRRAFFHGFGSCSFREPLDELAALAPLP